MFRIRKSECGSEKSWNSEVGKKEGEKLGRWEVEIETAFGFREGPRAERRGRGVRGTPEFLK